MVILVINVSVIWMIAVCAVIPYLYKAGNDISSMGGLHRVALTAFDTTVIAFGLGVFMAAGMADIAFCRKRFRAYLAVHII